MYLIKPPKLLTAVLVINTQNPKCVDHSKYLCGCCNHISMLILGFRSSTASQICQWHKLSVNRALVNILYGQSGVEYCV